MKRVQSVAVPAGFNHVELTIMAWDCEVIEAALGDSFAR
jgi:hypothetical protein